MALEIRPYREEEVQAFYRVPSVVFANYTGQDMDLSQSRFNIRPEWSLCAIEDGDLATTYAAYPFTMRLNGAPARAAGVTVVGTLPWFRRRGHLRKIMEFDFKRRYEEQMEPIAILIASIAQIYQRYGYAVVTSKTRYIIDPKWIALAPSIPEPRGSWREGTKDELPLLKDIYKQFVTPRNGYLHRGAPIWEGQVLGANDEWGAGQVGPSIIAIYEEDGQPQGYVTFAAKFLFEHLGHGGPGQRIFVRDYAWLRPSAYHAMWPFLKNFDLAEGIVVDKAAADDPAFDIMLNPRELNANRADWILARIIDIERALPLRPYGAEGRIVMRVRDEMCPWNDDTWALEVTGTEGQISRTKESPQIDLHVSSLVQLLFGQTSPTTAVRIGRADAVPNAPLGLWDAMFKTAYAPFCPDTF
jgi:predicted acetyltransferase